MKHSSKSSKTFLQTLAVFWIFLSNHQTRWKLASTEVSKKGYLGDFSGDKSCLRLTLEEFKLVMFPGTTPYLLHL